MSIKRKKTNNILISIIVFIFLCVSGYFGTDYFMDTSQNSSQIANENYINSVQITTAERIENADEVNLDNDKLNIIFFYVGQADCTLIKIANNVMLIDCGNNNDGKNVVDFLNEKNIGQIDYLVGTHADEDHIGGIDDVLKNIEVGTLFLPTVGSAGKDYKNAIEAANSKGIEVQNPTMGDCFTLGQADFEIMSAMEEEGISDNNSSIVIELKYKNSKYLFMGDAETEVENSREWEKVDVLKVGHHGSNSSSSEKFLNQVKPQYSIITKILRTDKANGEEVGSFWLTSDGNAIDIKEVSISLDGD